MARQATQNNGIVKWEAREHLFLALPLKGWSRGRTGLASGALYVRAVASTPMPFFGPWHVSITLFDAAKKQSTCGFNHQKSMQSTWRVRSGRFVYVFGGGDGATINVMGWFHVVSSIMLVPTPRCLQA